MDQSGHIGRVHHHHHHNHHTQLDETNVQTTLQSLDTVRALHQTVVSLREALENSHKEIEKLKKQIVVHTEVKEGNEYHERFKDECVKIDVPISKKEVKFTKDENVEEISTPKSDQNYKKVYQKTEIVSDVPGNLVTQKFEEHVNLTDSLKNSKKNKLPKYKKTTETQRLKDAPFINFMSYPEFSRKAMASKIDVKIKVSSNIQIDSSTESSSELDSARSEQNEKNHEEDDDKTPENDFKINITSPKDNKNPENLEDEPKKEHLSDNLHLSIDNISINSMSEGDNSVFAEDVATPSVHQGKSKNDSTNENHEEVDDIELIFSSDEKHDMLQEDLVSISDYEPWQQIGVSGTPVLVKFSSIQSDASNKSQHQRSVESNDSFSYEQKSSSFEKDFYLDPRDEPNLQRDESLDTFDIVKNSALGKKWKNNVLIETDISKCGINDENILDMGRRNTCPNPVPYKPIMHREALASCLNPNTPCCSLAVKFSRSPRFQNNSQNKSARPILGDLNRIGPKRSSSAQTDISALPEEWRSESHLASERIGFCGTYTLPSKFVPSISSYKKYPLRPSDKTQEARRVLLSDINFTSMVPELSRSADHLCQEDDKKNDSESKSPSYIKGNLLKTPDYALRRITPSASMNSPGASQWTVNENSFGTQTLNTGGGLWENSRGNSFDSCKSYSMSSRYSNGLSKNHRSKSVPSVRCVACKMAHGSIGMRTSESMNYNQRVSFQETPKSIRGSLPDLRYGCTCPRRYGGTSLYKIHGDSEGSTESLLDEADDFLRHSVDGKLGQKTPDYNHHSSGQHYFTSTTPKRVNRRSSENDIRMNYTPPKQSLPFLPKSPKCLKPGYLAKVISKNGRVVVGRIKYIGPLANSEEEETIYVGLQLASNLGECDGSIDGRKFFDCQPLHGIFVPFKKVVMAWSS